MNPQKAIEMLSLKPITGDKSLDKDMADAMHFGREAIKVLLHGRLIGAHHDPAHLPGETQE